MKYETFLSCYREAFREAIGDLDAQFIAEMADMNDATGIGYHVINKLAAMRESELSDDEMSGSDRDSANEAMAPTLGSIMKDSRK